MNLRSRVPPTRLIGLPHWGAQVGLQRALSRGLFLVVWAAANEPALRWMLTALAQPVHAVQRTLWLALAAWCAIDFLTLKPSASRLPYAGLLLVLCVSLTAAARLGTDVNTLHATMALLTLFAMSASFMEFGAWRRRLLLLAVMLLCLPIQSHIDAHLGLPLRLWTAQFVAPLLSLAGLPNLSVESIIVTENGVADVASACSGVRTLWYAMALWLVAGLAWPQVSWRRWWLAGALSALVAVGLNALRVAVLVLATDFRATPMLVEMAHASLGLMALAAVAALNVGLCRHGIPSPREAGAVLAPGVSWRASLWAAACVATLLVLPTPTRPQAQATRTQQLAWPADFGVKPVALTPSEHALLAGRGAILTEKHQFHREGVRGYLLVVHSSDWRAHHAPELCLLAQGVRIEGLRQLTGRQGNFRVLTLQAGQQLAITWFQSGARVVPDISTRLWSQLWRRDERWSLVTMVVDAPISDETLQQLHQAVHGVVHEFSGESL